MKRSKVKKRNKTSPLSIAIIISMILLIGYKSFQNNKPIQPNRIHEVGETQFSDSTPINLDYQEDDTTNEDNEYDSTSNDLNFDDESVNDENPVGTVIDTTVPKPPGFFKNITNGWIIIFRSFLNLFQ